MTIPRRERCGAVWPPLLSGDIRERALATVGAIARALPPPGEVPGPGLADGAAGIALFYHTLSTSQGGAVHAATSVQHLNSALRAAATTRLSPGLFSGVAGIAWAAQHIAGRLTPGAATEHW